MQVPDDAPTEPPTPTTSEGGHWMVVYQLLEESHQREVDRLRVNVQEEITRLQEQHAESVQSKTRPLPRSVLRSGA